MIIAVEGPSAAGKTHWLRRHWPDNTVWEADVRPDAPDRARDPVTAERYWAARNSDRWSQAILCESNHELVFCDTDPLKLHYVWSLWRTGEASFASWRRAVEIHREMLQRREIGFADAVIISIPDETTLRQQKESDKTRRRRNFEKHVKLAGHLHKWYLTLDSIEPGRVLWEFPVDADSLRDALQPDRRSSRYSRNLFEALVRQVSAL